MIKNGFFFQHGEIVARVDGANAPELTEKVEQQSQVVPPPPPPAKEVSTVMSTKLYLYNTGSEQELIDYYRKVESLKPLDNFLTVSLRMVRASSYFSCIWIMLKVSKHVIPFSLSFWDCWMHLITWYRSSFFFALSLKILNISDYLITLIPIIIETL